MENFWVEDEEKPKLQGLGDFHLRSALTQPNLEQLREGKGRNREQRSWRLLDGKEVHLCDPGRLLALLFFIAQYHVEMPEQIDHWDDVLELGLAEHSALSPFSVAGDKWAKTLSSLENNTPVSVYTSVRRKLNLLVVRSILRNSGRVWEDLENSIQYEGNHPFISIGGIRFYMLGEFIAIKFCKSLKWGDLNENAGWRDTLTSLRKDKRMGQSVFLLSLDMIRMFSDKFSERENIDFAIGLGHENFPEEFPHPDILKRLYSIMDSRLFSFGNHFYKFVKTFEAIVTGVILEIEPSLYASSQSFLTNTIKDLPYEFHKVGNQLVDLLWERRLNMHHRTQIFGLFRIWGHPVVETKAGLDKVFEIGGKKKHIDKELPHIVGDKFKEIFFTNYREKEKEYPKYEWSGNPSYITDCLDTNQHINLKDPTYFLGDWRAVKVKKTFDIPKSFNLAMIIADKAVSVDRHEILEAEGDPVKILDPYKRRGVLKWIKNGLVDCGTLLKSVNANPCGLPKTSRIIGLYPKERENNPTARMFSLMSLMMRAYIVVTENMLSTDVLKYIPGVTMTYNLLDLTKTMIRSTRDLLYQGNHSRTFSINIDFEKWNLNFRQEATKPVFTTLGELYGLTQLYNRTYDIFRNSVLYLSDGTYLPKFSKKLDWIDDHTGLSKIGHLAGLEGLRQKGWTVFTAVVIAYVCDKLKIDYKLMGQGDNQVLVVKIYSDKARYLGIENPHSVREICGKRDKLLEELTKEFLKLGLPIKPLETWMSDKFFSYGKVPIYKGLPCSMSLKKVARIFAFSNEDMMTTDNALGAIVANSQAAAMSSFSFVVPYMIQKLQTLLCLNLFLDFHPLIGDKPTNIAKGGLFCKRHQDGRRTQMEDGRRVRRKDFLLLAASVPKTFGGFNTSNAFKMIMRGFPDPASLDASWMYAMVQKSSNSVIATGLRNFLRVIYDEVRDFSFLIQDPTAINILIPPATSSMIKNMVREQLASIKGEGAATAMFYGVIRHTDRKVVEKLCELITATEALNVRFLHDIIGATLFGYCDAISSKIDKTVTLSRMTAFNYDVVGVLARGEREFWEYFKWRMQYDKGNSIMEKCPTRYVERVRNQGWGKEVLGVTTPFPHSFLSPDKLSEVEDDHIYAVISERALWDSGYLFTKLGKSLPYLGSEVQEKVQQGEVALAFGSEPLISRPVRLLRAIGWFISETSNWALLIKDLLRAVSDLDPDILISVPEAVKGSMVHRFRDFSTSHGTFWGLLYGPCSHIVLSTNLWKKYQRDGTNYTLQYQAVLLYAQAMVYNRASSSNDRSKVLRLYESCPDCIVEVPDKFPELEEPISRDVIPSDPSNQYLFIPKEDVDLMYKKIFSDLENYEKISLDQIEGESKNFYWYLVEKLAAGIPDRRNLVSDSEMQTKKKGLFKRVNPYDLLRKVLVNLWKTYHTDENFGRRTPCWARDKEYIIRNLSLTPAEAFSGLGGIFFWPETTSRLAGYKWFCPPLSYPASSSGISISCKNSLIGLASSLDNLTCPYSTITNLEETRMAEVRKNVMCFLPSGDMRYSCTSCNMKTFLSSLYTSKDLPELMKLRCNFGHSVYWDIWEQKIKYITVTDDQIADELPSISPRFATALPQIRSKFPPPQIILNSASVWPSDLSQQSFVVPLLYDNRLVLSLPMIQIPTRSLSRVTEVLQYVSADVMQTGDILIMGDGFGWSSIAAAAEFGKHRVLSWDLIDTSASPPHILHQSPPPTHYHACYQQIDTWLSWNVVSDISSPLFNQSVELIYQKYGKLALIVSEIELCHDPNGDQNIDYPFVIKQISTIRSKAVLIKIMSRSTRDLQLSVEEVMGRWHHWAVLSTPESDLRAGISWVYARKRRSHPVTAYLDKDALQIINNHALDPNLEDVTSGSDWAEAIDAFNRELMEGPLFATLSSLVHSWFLQGGFSNWCSGDMTRLLNEIRHYKLPQNLVDREGNDRKYLFPDDVERITIRLVALAASMLEDPDKLVSFVRRRWQLKWAQKGKQGQDSSRFFFNPKIVSNGEDNPDPAIVREITRYARAAWYIREKEPGSILFRVYENKVEFDHISHKVRTPRGEKLYFSSSLTFPISKNASYAVAD